jgi:hypothetical protein
MAQGAKGEFDGVLAPDPDRQAPVTSRLLEQDDVVVLAGVDDPADVGNRHVEEVVAGGRPQGRPFCCMPWCKSAWMTRREPFGSLHQLVVPDARRTVRLDQR